MTQPNISAIRLLLIQGLPAIKPTVEMVWRVKAVGNIRPAGLWNTWQGTLERVEDEKLYITFPAMNVEEMENGANVIVASEFPNPDCEYFAVTIIPDLASTMPGRKVFQAAPEALMPFDHGNAKRTREEGYEGLADAISGKYKKISICEGLKIPFKIVPRHLCLYPPLWVQKLTADGSNAEQICTEWDNNFLKYVTQTRIDITMKSRRAEFFAAQAQFTAWLRQQKKNSVVDCVGWSVAFAIMARIVTLTAFALGGFTEEAKAALA